MMSLSGFGVLVVGPSGSGKTTFCNALGQFFTAIKRKFMIVNMDPANENMNYDVAIDIKELIQIEDVMKELNLGPNGALRYCMGFIHENISWLLDKMLLLNEKKESSSSEIYFIFDFPGQIELYMNDEFMKKIASILQKNDKISLSLTTVALFDCLCCYDPNQYIAASILSLITQFHLETPHINVLTKIDLLKQCGKLPYRLRMYFDNEALNLMIEEEMEINEESTEFIKKYHSLHEKIKNVIMDQNLISFFPLHIMDKINVCSLVAMIDKANGFYYYKENSKEKFADLRDVVFAFDDFDHEEIIMNLEEEMRGSYDEQDL